MRTEKEKQADRARRERFNHYWNNLGKPAPRVWTLELESRVFVIRRVKHHFEDTHLIDGVTSDPSRGAPSLMSAVHYILDNFGGTQ